MRIQHNIPAMSAYRNYTNNVSAMKKNLEKLSSGYKINRAGDDAAGLAISEKMRAQITGLQVAQKNAKDGISLVQTAEGALTEVHDMLNRMYSLAEQSANGTYDNEVDRVQLQKEIDSLRTEIDRISESANFNGIKLLNGDQATTSTSALGATATVVDGSAINGTSPSAAGAAEITVGLRSSAASNSTPLDSVSAKDGDGSNVIPATKAVIELKVGGVAGDPTQALTGVKINGKANGSALTDAGTFTVKGGEWKAGDYVEFTANGHTFKFTYDNSETGHAAADGWVTATSATAINAELAQYGLALDTTTDTAAFVHASAGVISGFDNTNAAAAITAGTTTIDGLKDLEVIAGTKLGDQFDIEVYDSTGTKRTTGADEINNGDKIVLTAKKAGALETDGTAKVFDKLKALTATYPAGVTDTDAQAALAGKVTATNGKDEGYSDAGIKKTKYEITFDVADLTGGKKITIGSKSITFSALDPAAAGTLSGNNMVVNVAKKDANANGNTDEVAADIKTALDTVFPAANFETATWVKNDDGTYTYSVESKTGADDDATNANIVAANMGEVRVFQANKDGTGETDITDTDKAIHSTYTQGVEKDTTAPAQNAFAKVTYAITDDMLKVGNKLTIGGVEIEIASATDAKAGKVSSTKATFQADLAKVLEEQGYTAGKVSVATGTGTAAGQNGVATTATALVIEGTEVGQSAADFKAGAGAVSFYDKSKAPSNKVANSDSSIEIEAGKTKVSDLLGKEMIAASGSGTSAVPAKKLGDLFTVTDANGRELAKDHVIADGETIKFVAKNKGALDQTTLDKLKFTGEANVTVKNGWDEGSSASGDRTHYELQFDLNNLHGGQSFTFGNDTNTVTFEITYDASGKTENGTINDKDNTNVNGDTNTNRVLINLYGKTTDKEKIDAIMNAFKDSAAAGLSAKFDSSYSATAGKMTVMLDAKGDGADYNWGNVRVSNNNSALTGSVYTPAGGAAQGTIGTYAQIAYEFDVSKLQEGDSLTVGGTTVYFGKEDKVERDGKGSKVTLALDAAKSDVSKIVKGLESAGYRSGKVAIDTSKNTITITGVDTGETADHLKTNGARISVGTTTNRPMSTGGLKLQIGDTAEDFNQMAVDIKKCSADAMGIGGIDISSQDGAVDAMAKIKDAINYVSDIRGGLGATQNRLDHTINNLSVMQENIQDAESSIRDVDVAEEMMAYTKNNILIQSAQAMLAQANQMPQGVLQLLG